jgi:hypothetical protein
MRGSALFNAVRQRDPHDRLLQLISPRIINIQDRFDDQTALSAVVENYSHGN